MKKSLIGSALAMLMFSTISYADITTCQLNTRCPLSHSGDTAYFPIFSREGNFYLCTVFVGKKLQEPWTGASISGADGFNYPEANCSLQAAHTSAHCKVIGNFTKITGKIKIQRTADTSYVGDSSVMCTKL